MTPAVETTEWEKYYYAGTVRLAMREDSNNPLYLIGDHLGSTSLVLDSAGLEVAKQSYLPFGEDWGVSATELPTDYTFTGQREAAEIGLHYYVARWYDSEVGHFLQADSIVPGPGNPLAWNRYAYVKYNPIIYIDPSGHTLFPPNRNIRMTDGGWGEQYRNYSPDDASSKAQSSTGTQVRDFVLEKVEESGRYNKNTDEDNWKKVDYCTVFVLWVATALDGGGWDSGLSDSTITFADQTPYNLTTLFLDYMSDRSDVSVSDNIAMPSSEQLENPDIARDFASNFRKGDIVLINQPDVWRGNLNHAYMVVAVDYQSGNVSVADYLQPDVNNFKDFNDVTYPIESFAVIRIDEFYFGGN